MIMGQCFILEHCILNYCILEHSLLDDHNCKMNQYLYTHEAMSLKYNIRTLSLCITFQMNPLCISQQ